MQIKTTATNEIETRLMYFVEKIAENYERRLERLEKRLETLTSMVENLSKQLELALSASAHLAEGKKVVSLDEVEEDVPLMEGEKKTRTTGRRSTTKTSTRTTRSRRTAGKCVQFPAQGSSEELEFFRKNIDLVKFAESFGFKLDKQRSTSGAWFMVNPTTKTKIIISRAGDGTWRFVNMDEPDDRGTIIDFIQSRQRKNLGEVRKMLRSWYMQNCI